MTHLKNRLLHFLRRKWTSHRMRGAGSEFSLRLPAGKVRRILQRNGIGFAPDGTATWWLASLELRRNEQDELTKGVLRHVSTKVSKEARILGTGCGTGWMLFWLAQVGFKNIEAFDYLPNVVQAAKEIAALGKIDATLWQADGFAPRLERSYDLMLFLHWVYSAWMGNYGNAPRGREDRETLPSDLLGHYAPQLAPGGLMVVELMDAISNYRELPTDIYPIRHTPEQVARCAGAHGLAVEHKMFNNNYGHLPRMCSFLRKA